MIQTQVTVSDFRDFLGKSDGYRTSFSYDGAKALFDYLEEYSDEVNEPMNYDPVAWCCEFTEYANLEELQKDYNNIENMEDLLNATSVIPVKGEAFIIQQF